MTGDVNISSNFQYWFNHIDKTHFLLKMFYTGLARVATVSEIGFSSTLIPTYINLSLKLFNQRIYELMNEKFE